MIENKIETVINAVLDLEMRFEALELITVEIQKPQGRIALNVFGTLIDDIHVLLWENLVVNASWLFEKPYLKSGKRRRQMSVNLYSLLEKILEKNVNQNEKQKVAELVDDLTQKLEANDQVVQKMKSIRDKWLVHRDLDVCNTPSEFLREIGLSLSDCRVVVETAKAIVEEYLPVKRLDQFDVHKLFWAAEYPDFFVEEVEKARELANDFLSANASM